MPPTIKTVQFDKPFQVSLIHQPRPASLAPDAVFITTTLTAISPGTELLAFKGHMPTTIPTDATFQTHQAPFRYPSHYGYAAVGTVTSLGTSATTLSPGDRVFAFREHTSAFSESPSNLIPIPASISDRDAAFLPAVETALTVVMDTRLIPGESVCVVGQGIVGLLIVACLKTLHPFSRVISADLRADRRDLSVKAGMADVSLDPTCEHFQELFAEAVGDLQGADVSVDVSGSGDGLDTAIECTRDYGRVVIASWYGTRSVTLSCLGGRFHRSHIELVSSQVSEVPRGISARWSKTRRLALAWRLIETLRPFSRFPPRVFPVERAQELYERLANGDMIHAMFEYA